MYLGPINIDPNPRLYLDRFTFNKIISPNATELPIAQCGGLTWQSHTRTPRSLPTRFSEFENLI